MFELKDGVNAAITSRIQFSKYHSEASVAFKTIPSNILYILTQTKALLEHRVRTAI